MDFSDLALRLIRAAGALASALAGIAALLTDGAFVKRDPPMGGRWRDFPFAKYRATPWGATLLAVILIAPAVQFIGDWVKDANDAKSLQKTIDKLKIDVGETVTASTAQARGEIVGTVKSEGQAQLSEAKKLDDQTSGIASGANHILEGVERLVDRFNEFSVDAIYEYPSGENVPGMTKLAEICDKVIGLNAHKDIHDWPKGLSLRGNGAMTAFWGLSMNPVEFLTITKDIVDVTTDKDAYQASYQINFTNAGLAVAFTKHRYSANSIKRDLFDNLEHADLVAYSRNEGVGGVQYSQKTRRLFIDEKDLLFASSDWKQNGEFGSVDDLGGAYMYVMLDEKLYGQQWDKDSLLSHLKPIWLVLRVSNFAVFPGPFSKVNNLPIFVTRLPAKNIIFDRKDAAVYLNGTYGRDDTRQPDIDDPVVPPGRADR
jgi:hypothetical protein